MIFFIFKKLFLKSAYQNDPKYIKINFYQNKKQNLNFLGTSFAPRSQTVPSRYEKNS
jgi:hypothetical protein